MSQPTASAACGRASRSRPDRVSEWHRQTRRRRGLTREFNFGFAVNWMRKDLAIRFGEARRNGAHLPVAALVDQFYSQVQKMGGGRWDTSSLIALLDR
jgi:3-hydroxyisobutyrate dehydrogenase